MTGKREDGYFIVTYVIDEAFSIPLSNIVKILARDHKIYAIYGSSNEIKVHDEIIFQNLHNIEYISSKSRVLKTIKYTILQLKIIIRILRLRKKYNRIIFFMDFPPFFTMLVGRIFLNKVIWLIPSKISLLSSDFQSKIVSFFYLLCNNLCHKIILYSPKLIKEWSLKSYNHKIIIAHRHFLDFHTYKVTTPYKERPFLIGYIGRLSAEKGVQYFAQALPAILNRNQDIRVLIGGDGQLKESIQSIICENDLEQRVNLPGWISHDDLPHYLNKLRLLILPSFTEGLPNIMLEAMACGTPVLATPVGAIPDIIKHRETGFIMDSNSPICITENVEQALACSRLVEIAEAGRKIVIEDFQFEKVAVRWESMLQAIR